jgi:hypothetical protein
MRFVDRGYCIPCRDQRGQWYLFRVNAGPSRCKWRLTNVDVRLVSLKDSSIVSGGQSVVAECSEHRVSSVGFGR